MAFRAMKWLGISLLLVISDPFAAEGHLGVPNVDALKVEAFDSCCGHPNPQEYHYTPMLLYLPQIIRLLSLLLLVNVKLIHDRLLIFPDQDIQQ